MSHSITLTIGVALVLLASAGCIDAGTSDPAVYGTADGGTIEPGVIRQSGSSTVLPLAEVWADDFGTARGVDVRVAGGGSGAGATGLCNGDLDLGDMSREMTAAEHERCQTTNGQPAIQWKVAIDGLSVVVSTENRFVHELSLEGLHHIFRAEDPARTWRDVDPNFPDAPIRLCYPDQDSGTYEYFNEVVLDGGHPREGDGVETSANDNVLVTCLERDANAIGYFGFAYLAANADKVRSVAIDGVAPTFETISSGEYTPLSRPIYVYSSGVPEGVLGDYMRYILHPEGGQRYVEPVGYVPLDEDTRAAMLEQFGA